MVIAVLDLILPLEIVPMDSKMIMTASAVIKLGWVIAVLLDSKRDIVGLETYLPK
jgi:hypothetical protein